MGSDVSPPLREVHEVLFLKLIFNVFGSEEFARCFQASWEPHINLQENIHL